MDFSLIYTSHCCEKGSLNGLLNIATKAAENNSKQGITGVLIFDDHYFFQVLEGSSLDTMYSVFDEKIAPHPMHDQIKLHGVGPITARNFPNWRMRACYNASAGIAHLHHNLPEVKDRDVDNALNAQCITLVVGLIKQTLAIHGLELTTSNRPLRDQLTQRESEVLDKLLRGYMLASIAEELKISAKTVSRHIENIRGKLGCKTKHDIIKRVYETGQVTS